MTFDDNIIIGKSVFDGPGVINKLKENKTVINHYIVAVDVSGKNLEIYPTLQFMNNHMWDRNIKVVGIFRRNDEAVEFISDLCEQSVKKFGEVDLVKMLPYYVREDE